MKTLLYLISTVVLVPSLFGQTSSPADLGSFPLYLKVELDKSIKLSALKPQDLVEGRLSRDVYSADRKIMDAGSRIQLRVDHLERQRRPADDHWPWIVRAFSPRYQKVPSFQEAVVSSFHQSEKPLQVRVIAAEKPMEIKAPSTQKQRRDARAKIGQVMLGPNSLYSRFARSHVRTGQFLFLQAGQVVEDAPALSDAALSSRTPEDMPAGTSCRVLLLNGISASKSHAGDSVQARLLEPVVVNSRVILPAGTLFEGKVAKTTPPRWLSRPGSLSITFTGLKSPEGEYAPVMASLSALELDKGSHVKMDAEGHLHGDRPGMAWTLINGGVSAGIAKEVDDGTQLLLEAVLSGATMLPQRVPLAL